MHNEGMISTEATSPERSWARLDGIDLLRGLAIFFVLMNHVTMRLLGAHISYTHGLPRQLVSSLVWNGQYGVQIFFAVSGFSSHRPRFDVGVTLAGEHTRFL